MIKRILRIVAIGFAIMAVYSLYQAYMARSHTCTLVYENTHGEFSARIRNTEGQLIHSVSFGEHAPKTHQVELPLGDYAIELRCGSEPVKQSLSIVGSGEYTLRCP